MAISFVYNSVVLKRTLSALLVSKRCYSIQPPAWLGGFRARGVDFKFEFPEHQEKFDERMKKLLKEQNGDMPEPKNIGAELSTDKTSIANQYTQAVNASKSNKTLEKAARHRSLFLPLDEVKSDWLVESAPEQIKTIAEHYGIYKDLFANDFFYPTTNMSIFYDFNEESFTPVCTGNIISPSEARKAPLVDIESQPDQLWTLLMVNPDENLTNQNEEYIHWAVTNIPGGDISKGEVLVDYFQPISPAGTGYHRNVFVLFEQKGKMDFEELSKIGSSLKLDDRHFKTETFFKKYESELTPRSLAFFQCQWDETVRDYFRNTLDMKEPSFEYEHPVPYHPPQKKFPHKQPFNLYIDRYRDKKDIAEEVLRIKMKETTPFAERKPAYKYPMDYASKKYKPSWLIQKEDLMRRRLEQFRDLK